MNELQQQLEYIATAIEHKAWLTYDVLVLECLEKFQLTPAQYLDLFDQFVDARKSVTA